jgi:hypothetical protein
MQHCSCLVGRAQLARSLSSRNFRGLTPTSTAAPSYRYKSVTGLRQSELIRQQQRQQQRRCSVSHCMTGWAEEWTSALIQRAKSNVDDVQRPVVNAATHTPHPAPASSREASEWEAVLSATDAAAVPPATAAAAIRDEAGGFKNDYVFAVIELGSHSTRLLLNDAVSGTDVVSAPHSHHIRHVELLLWSWPHRQSALPLAG